MRPSLLAALLAAVVLALAACGGGDGGADTESTGASDTGAAAPTTGAVAPPTTEESAGEPFQINVPSSAPIGPTSPPKTIKQLQRALQMLGFDVGTPDGIWGDKTSKAVKKFQRQNKLQADGLVGAKTAKAINKELAQQPA